MKYNIKYIRNFAIVAHIDHGKTTLSDCLIQKCCDIKKMNSQFLDNLKVEKERGITVKAQTICLPYMYNGTQYIFNLIDTPGHVDFSYEVSRAMQACEGALLLVDATQGVEAQTLSNAEHAKKANLTIIPVLNKVDLSTSDPQAVTMQIVELLHITTTPLLVSAKTGIGIDDIFKHLIENTPPPTGDSTQPFKALLIDSWYDQYSGVILLVRIIDGSLSKDTLINFLAKNKTYKVIEIGIIRHGMQSQDKLQAGEIGYIIANIKTLTDCLIGDTIVKDKDKDTILPLPGFKKNLPIVFCGVFPVEKEDYEILNKSLDKLALNDSSFSYEHIQSPALGMGFRCGFLGMLHMDVNIQRLEHEFNIMAVITMPSVNYNIVCKDKSIISINNPTQMPAHYEYIEEPMTLATIFVPHEYMGGIMDLCSKRFGIMLNQSVIGTRMMLEYRMPLREIVFDFYDKLKSISHGYASFDYKLTNYEISDIVPVSILINSDPIDALSFMAHKTQAEKLGRDICLKLKDNLPRQQVQIIIQAAIGAKIIARETLSSVRKDVIAGLYGGDRTRKDKLLDKQKKGKQKMKELSVGNIKIPTETMRVILGFKSNK